MVKDFDRQMKEKADGCTHVLLLDGHNSHYSTKLVNFAHDNNIIILGYPPHCMHALQGLDVVCFLKMKDEFHSEINAFEKLHHQGVGKDDFIGVFGQAYQHTFTLETVKAAFEATCIHPFNPNVIKDSQLKPSLLTSTKASFPLLVTSHNTLLGNPE